MFCHFFPIQSTEQQYRQIQEALRRLFEQQQETLQIVKQAYEITLKPIIETTEQLRRSFDSIQNSIAVLRRVRELHSITFPSFYTPPTIEAATLVIERPIDRRRRAEDFATRLLKCPPGKKGWRRFEVLCEEILSYLFQPPLRGPHPQEWTADGIFRRDILFYIPATEGGFWVYLVDNFNSSSILFDCKNWRKKIPPREIDHVANYLHDSTVGRFGVVISRGTISKKAEMRIIGLWKDYWRAMTISTVC